MTRNASPKAQTRNASPKAQSRRSSVRTVSPTRQQQAGNAMAQAAGTLETQIHGAKEEGSDEEPANAGPSASMTTPSVTSDGASPKRASTPLSKSLTKAPANITIVTGREGIQFPSSLAAPRTAPPPCDKGTQDQHASHDGEVSVEDHAMGDTSAQEDGSVAVRPTSPSANANVATAEESTSTRSPRDESVVHTTDDEPMLDDMPEVYEDEGLLEHDHSDESWCLLESRFSQCNVMITFSLTDVTVAVPGKGYLGIQDMAGWIIKLLGARGVSFGCEGLQVTGGQDPILLGRPSALNRSVWSVLRRGYLKVLGVTVWMQPAYTGRRASNLSLLELEYVNTNAMSAKSVHAVMQRWGATEALVVSHGRGQVRRSKWPAIECVTNAVRNPKTNEYAFTFRLFFECEEVANKVYAASLSPNRDDLADIQHAESIRLKPVINVDWDPRRGRMYRPTDAQEREHVSRRVHVFGLSHELTVRQVEQRLDQLGFRGARLATQPGRKSGTVELQSPEDVERIMAAYGRDKYQRLYIGNVSLSFNTPASDGSMRCFKCNEGGHFQRDCTYGRENVRSQPNGRPGRANAYWQTLNADRDSGNPSVAPGWTLPGGRQVAQVEPRATTSQELIQQAEPMLRQLIASQVREQTHAVLTTVRQDMDRQMAAVGERIVANEGSIRAIQSAQAAETKKTDRMELMLLNLSEHLLPADFRRGEDEGVAPSRHIHDGATAVDVQRLGIVDPRHAREPSSSSSDDSWNSEASDRMLMLGEDTAHTDERRRRQRRRRTWVPAVERPPAIVNDGARAVLDEILRREHFVEQYVGDADSDLAHRQTIRMVATNVAGGLNRRMHDEILPWALANRADFVAVSDSGWRSDGARTIWRRAEGGGQAPAYVAVGTERATLLMSHDRWATRWKRDATRTSPSGRSIAVTLRLGGHKELTVVTTYCPDSPADNAADTHAERLWLSQQSDAAHAAGRICVMAGDFNNYASEVLDRQGPVRPRRLQQESEAFARWTQSTNMVSSFRHRHPETPRFTYQNGGTKSALDDIFVSSTHAGLIVASSVWLFSLNQGDHVGTPFAEFELRGESTGPSGRLRDAENIKVLRVKGRSAAELETFTQLADDRIAAGVFKLGEDAPPLDDEQRVRSWLDASIRHLYEGMYSAAKTLWGERSQAQRYINACVSKKRSMRCQGQLKVARRLWLEADVTADDIVALVRKIQWPKWIVHPERTPPTSPHAQGARLVHDWRLSECPPTPAAAQAWAEEGWRLWKRVLRSRRDWRTRSRQERRCRQRASWMEGGNVRQLLRDTFGPPLPPIKIRGALREAEDGIEYEESRGAVTRAMTDLLDTWVPQDERTHDPAHLTSHAVEDEAALPRFVREWLLDDIKVGGTHQASFTDHDKGWASFEYDEERQRRTDRSVSKGVAPGYGGVHQELWVAAPASVRARERLIFNVIIQSGVVPSILNHRQMVFLPKSENASNVWERQGLPPWRPITMQSAFATRLFTALSSFLEAAVPNNANQHGFQRDRTVQDASLATTLLTDRARRRKEPLYLLSKDCEKCYDRIPRWVMTYIYQRLGVPTNLLSILTAFLSAGTIDVRTDYGWVSTGQREFGLGQGSVLSIRHIGYYMDVLIERQSRGPGAVQPSHSQPYPAPPITSIVLVDDVVDVATSHSAICDRASVSNVFTGLEGTGGVFGASKSFLLSVRPGRPRHEPPVFLADGKSRPRAVAYVSPHDGFKHLGVFQSSTDMWSNTLSPIWRKVKQDAQKIVRAKPSLRELRYIVNSVWLPRLAYRTQLSSVVSYASHIDKLVRRVARQSLRLPFNTATELFHDAEHGLGLQCFEDSCRASRVALALRVLNSPHVPARHLLVEALEDYQKLAGLTSHPFAAPLPPPSHLHGWTIDTIRAAAALGASIDIEWTNPVECTSTRPADRSLWRELPSSGQRRLLQLNVTCRAKLRFVGDLADRRGRRLLSCDELSERHQWSARMRTGYFQIEGIIRAHLCVDGTDRLTEPVGRTHHPTGHLHMSPVAVAPGGFFLVSQFAEVFNDEGTATDIVLRYHELGQRIGDGTSEDEYGNGRVISVQWWHERVHGSGIWSVRPDGIGKEFADIILPISVTPVGPRSRPMASVILWRDTNKRGVYGLNDRNMIDIAFTLSHARFHARRRGHLDPGATRACGGCNRLRDVTFCPVCTTWHHPECVQCGIA